MREFSPFAAYSEEGAK
jgi:hypothetical protein